MFEFTAVILISLIFAISVIEADPVVCLEKEMCVRGKKFKGNLKEFEGFLGIPYAQKPVNELRLKDPQPVEKWNGTYDASEEKAWCMQKNYLLPNPIVQGVEDCLYLYVYRPKKITGKNLLPVLIYIHGGGFFAGSAGPSISGPNYFMDTENVIFVSMNYRLGPLGFLSTGDNNMNGNFGLKDQALAIKWVKDHISAFGGNSSNIALMGQSAGASSVHLQMMSNPKLSRNLFQSVVMLSGNGNGPYAYVIKNPINQAKQFAKAVGIKNYADMNSSVLAEKLRYSDPEALINACDELKIWSVDPLTISRPVIEDCKESDGFLCDDPIYLWRTGNHAKVPMLTGFMDGDGGVRALAIIEDELQLNDLNKRFDELMPKLMEIENPSSEITEDHLRKIKARYFKGRDEINDENSEGLIRLYTERSFITPLINTIQQLVEQDQKTLIFMYKFSFKGPLSYSMFYTGKDKNYGVVHCDELVYLLHSPKIFPHDFKVGSVETQFRSNFVGFITDFAINGKPSRINNKLVQKCGFSEKFQKPVLKCNYIEFAENSTVKLHEMDSSVADFWNEIDNTMVRRQQNHPIELTKKLKNNPLQQTFTSQHLNL